MTAIVCSSARAAGPAARSSGRTLDHALTILATVLAAGLMAAPWISAAVMPDDRAEDAAPASISAELRPGAAPLRETYIAGYISQPFYLRSDVHLTRPDGTDVVLEQLGWDGDALYPPIDGGIRSMQWTGATGPTGYMIDFLHNKAVSRLGKGAHGRKISNGIVDEVQMRGTLKGAPAPTGRVKLTDVFERLEFTHGHNVLMFTPLLRLGTIMPGVHPYVGLGAGLAMPHVEVWFPGDSHEQRTNEYQLAGVAAQALAGLEIRTGKVSYFIEYKFSWAGLSTWLTGGQSWMNFNMPGDLVNQFTRWWSGEKPKFGTLSTQLAAHQIGAGVGYWWQRGSTAVAAP